MRKSSSRLDAASSQLEHARADVQLAGVADLFRLADSRVVRSQDCVDLLCQRLRRAPADDESCGPASGADDAAVRRAVLQGIAARLRPSDVAHRGSRERSWSALHFDPDGAVLPDADLSGVCFGPVNLQNE